MNSTQLLFIYLFQNVIVDLIKQLFYNIAFVLFFCYIPINAHIPINAYISINAHITKNAHISINAHSPRTLHCTAGGGGENNQSLTKTCLYLVIQQVHSCHQCLYLYFRHWSSSPDQLILTTRGQRFHSHSLYCRI